MSFAVYIIANRISAGIRLLRQTGFRSERSVGSFLFLEEASTWLQASSLKFSLGASGQIRTCFCFLLFRL